MRHSCRCVGELCNSWLVYRHLRDVYSSEASIARGGPDDSDKNRRWIPTTSSSQYAATLAQWSGVASADLSYVLPSLGNFAQSNLGFLG
jgi:hypothetical protein